MTDAQDDDPDRHDVAGDARFRVDLARQLEQAVPAGWAVSVGCVWSPARSGGLLLRPDVAVHRPLVPDAGLTEPPRLCVSITPARLDERSARPYARSGVDHYWHLDSRSSLLEVLVRVDAEYRHAESIELGGPGPDAAAGPTGTAPWVDFGIGVVELTLPTGTAHHRGGQPHA